MAKTAEESWADVLREMEVQATHAARTGDKNLAPQYRNGQHVLKCSVDSSQDGSAPRFIWTTTFDKCPNLTGQGFSPKEATDDLVKKMDAETRRGVAKGTMDTWTERWGEPPSDFERSMWDFWIQSAADGTLASYEEFSSSVDRDFGNAFRAAELRMESTPKVAARPSRVRTVVLVVGLLILAAMAIAILNRL
jgi:hypothetical protein